MKDLRKFDKGGDATYPALRFQRLFALDNIGRQWRMPLGMSMAEMEAALWRNRVLELWSHCPDNTVLNTDMTEKHTDIAARFGLAWDIADALILLNPDLRNVICDRDNWGHIRGLLHGVVSGFNCDDIQAWIDKTIDYELGKELRDFIRKEFYDNAADSVYPPLLRQKFAAATQSGKGFCEDMIDLLHWAPSEKTIYRIYDQMEAKRCRVTRRATQCPR